MLTVNPEEIHDGTCRVVAGADSRWAVCKEGRKLEIFEIDER